MFLNPSELTLGEAYVYDDFDIEGDLDAAFDFADHLLGQEQSLAKSFDLAEWLEELPVNATSRTRANLSDSLGSAHSKDRDRQAISSLRSSCRFLRAMAGSAHDLLLCLLWGAG